MTSLSDVNPISMEVVEKPRRNAGIEGASCAYNANEFSPQSTPAPASAPSQVSLDQNTIQQILLGLKDASTMLPSRDIPQSTYPIQSDPNSQLDYLPPPPPNSQQNYIHNYERSPSEIIMKQGKQQQNTDQWDKLYEELKIPFLLGLLYFIFQLSFLRKYLFLNFPMLFLSDGNPHNYYMIITSLLFAFVFYISNKFMNLG
jgi:hypothetical protein